MKKGRNNRRETSVIVIKKANDFILGIFMIAVSAFLFFGKVTSNVPEVSQGGLIARPDVWIQMVAVLLFIVAVILVILSMDITGKAEKEAFHFVLDSTVILTIGALILYAVLLPKAGFAVTTFLMTAFLTALYTLKEEKRSVKSLDKREIIRIGRKSIITGAVLLIILWLVFGRLLAIQLP